MLDDAIERWARGLSGIAGPVTTTRRKSMRAAKTSQGAVVSDIAAVMARRALGKVGG